MLSLLVTCYLLLSIAVIIDFHTHIFPPEVIAERDAYVDADRTFAELYSNPKARLATAEDLLRSMDDAGIDFAVALGFAWTAEDDCRRHNDYLLETAERTGQRIIPFCTLPLAAGIEAIAAEARRCSEGMALGFGELRPENLGLDITGVGGDALAEAAGRGGARPLLFHASEPVGHAYRGKQGLDIGALYAFVQLHLGARVIAAHWGGGLPFYAAMPEVRSALTHTWFDTAASSLLYDASVYRRVVDLIGARRVLFGSDFPLLSQKRCLERLINDSRLEPEELQLILGGNSAALWGDA